jgi:hypothetical protein
MATYKYNKPTETDLFNLKTLADIKIEHNLTHETDEELEFQALSLGYRKVLISDIPDDGYVYVSRGFIEIDGVLCTNVFKIAEEQAKADLEDFSKRMKIKRNNLLAESDWTQIVDVPLSVEVKQQWAEYRQALRDLTAQEKFPWKISWPVAPV